MSEETPPVRRSKLARSARGTNPERTTKSTMPASGSPVGQLLWSLAIPSSSTPGAARALCLHSTLARQKDPPSVERLSRGSVSLPIALLSEVVVMDRSDRALVGQKALVTGANSGIGE